MTAPAPTPTSARLADNARRVAPVQWKVLLVFLAVGVVCAGVYAYAYVNRPAPLPALPPATPNDVATPAGASGFLGRTQDAKPDAKAESMASAHATTTDTWAGWAGAKGTAVGFGFAGGFVLGFVFRAFLKVMTLVTVVVLGGLAALSYFGVLNLDFTAARTAYENNAAWLTDQATRLKDVVLAHLPGSSSATAGLLLGMRRR